jgi:hypothetical protein
MYRRRQEKNNVVEIRSLEAEGGRNNYEQGICLTHSTEEDAPESEIRMNNDLGGLHFERDV